MNSYIRVFTLDNHGYTPEYQKTIYHSNGPFLTYGYDRKLYYGSVISATLTQEINTGGTLTLSIKKPETENDMELRNLLNNYTRYIEVQTPYGKDGNPDYADEYITKWRGTRIRTTTHPDKVDLIYEGELSYLSSVFTEPYTTTNQTTSGFVQYMLSKYNSGAEDMSHLKFLYAFSSSVDEGPSVVRSNSSISSVWKEINEKVLDKYNNQVSVCGYSSSDQRVVYMRGLPTTASGHINGQDIITVDHEVDSSERGRYWTVYGTNNGAEGDTDRISSTYQYNQTDYKQKVRRISHQYKIYDEITTTETLTSRAQQLYEQSLIDSDSINLTILPEKAEELMLGSLYQVQCAKAGISGEYRLTKRVINVLNPAKNKYTFGKCERHITR